MTGREREVVRRLIDRAVRARLRSDRVASDEDYLGKYRHGYVTAYRHGCRCNDCRYAAKEARNRARRFRLATDPDYVARTKAKRRERYLRDTRGVAQS